jgi:hypothetical protein
MNATTAGTLLRRALLGASLPLALVACAGDKDPSHTPEMDGSGDGSGEVTAREDRVGGVNEDLVPQATQYYVAQTFSFARIEDGVTVGFDLDGHTTTSQAEGCDILDYVSPDGVEGIDSQFATLLPTLEQIGGSALPLLVQAALNEGDLILLFDLQGLDDWQNDDEVAVSLQRGLGQPIIGGNDLMLPFQTFDLDLEKPGAFVEGGVLVDGSLYASPIEVSIPFFVFDSFIEVTLENGVIRMDMQDDGSILATIGGGVSLEQINEIASIPGIGTQINELLPFVAERAADLRTTPGGDCDALSAVVQARLIPAFVFE